MQYFADLGAFGSSRELCILGVYIVSDSVEFNQGMDPDLEGREEAIDCARSRPIEGRGEAGPHAYTIMHITISHMSSYSISNLNTVPQATLACLLSEHHPLPCMLTNTACKRCCTGIARKIVCCLISLLSKRIPLNLPLLIHIPM